MKKEEEGGGARRMASANRETAVNCFDTLIAPYNNQQPHPPSFDDGQQDLQRGWTQFENKLFEKALVLFPEDSANRWQMIADQVPRKSAEEVRLHYEALVQDVLEIDSGRVELPNYLDDGGDDDDDSAFGFEPETQISFGGGGGKLKHVEVERKKGTPWTEEEHRLFLVGLDRYGKGDWRSISRNVVVTRTPTQVASHAQKYYLRQNSMKKERKRSSIHDITTTADTQHVPPPSNFSNQAGSVGYQNFGFPM